jgi:pimeloyl-ACP methyl ester carboxylesterase
VTEAGPAAGPPVLLLHGFPDARDLWRHQVVALAAAGHRVVAPDLRGFGDSERPTDVEAYAMRRLVGDVVGLMDALGLRRAALVGHDWGAVLAWAVTMAHPDRVDRLVAVSVGHPSARAGAGLAQQVKGGYVLGFLVPGVAERTMPAGGYWWLRHYAWRGASIADTPDLARQIEHLSRPGALAAGLAWYRANIALPRPRLGRTRRDGPTPSTPRRSRTVTCPVMGVWSSRDPVLTEAQMTGSARFVDGPWRYERIEGVGHWVPVEAPQELSDLLVDFLRPGGGAASPG